MMEQDVIELYSNGILSGLCAQEPALPVGITRTVKLAAVQRR